MKKKYDCSLYIGEGILEDIDSYLIPLLPGKHIVLITNPLIKKLYGNRIFKKLSKNNFVVNMIQVPDGEKSKSLSIAENVYGELLQLKADRSTTLITLGGGVIGDLGGFIAATFMRGIPLAHIPTTLLAQIDSSIGGKVAVDHSSAKNIIGSFYQPIANLVDPGVLDTLPMSHIKNGIVEAIKIAIICSPSFFSWIYKNIDKLLHKDSNALDYLVRKAAKLKIDIILQDPWEKNERHFLNLGHSIGHALETIGGYDRLTHGEAVAMGIILEARIAFYRNILLLKDREKIENIIRKLQIKLNFDLSKVDPEECWKIIHLDKKNKDGCIRFVLPERIGKVKLFQPIQKRDIDHAFSSLKNRERKE